jgi:2-dehydropantoate 2-reductase
MRVLVFGAGVIGQIYAGRLSAAGHSVSLVCRPTTAARIKATGIILCRNGIVSAPVFPKIVVDAADAGIVDIALIAIRRDQVVAAAPELRRIQATTIVSLIDLPLGIEELAEELGAERFVPAFPGVAGVQRSDGVVDYLEVDQQPTTVGRSPREPLVTALLRSARFSTGVSNDMRAWLQTHAVFITAFESAIIGSPGGLSALAANSSGVRSLVLAVREGLIALRKRNTPILPTSIRVIFLVMPVWFATRYWRRALAGPLGALGMAPHSLASRETELPALQDDVRAILRGQNTPRLDAIFATSTTGLVRVAAKIPIA